MTILKFTKAECANYVLDTCILSGKPCNADKKRCGYFEKCLMGLKKYKEHLDWEKGVNEYISLHKLGK